MLPAAPRIMSGADDALYPARLTARSLGLGVLREGPRTRAETADTDHVQAMKADKSRLSACTIMFSYIRLLSGCESFAGVISLAAHEIVSMMGLLWSARPHRRFCDRLRRCGVGGASG